MFSVSRLTSASRPSMRAISFCARSIERTFTSRSRSVSRRRSRRRTVSDSTRGHHASGSSPLAFSRLEAKKPASSSNVACALIIAAVRVVVEAAARRRSLSVTFTPSRTCKAVMRRSTRPAYALFSRIAFARRSSSRSDDAAARIALRSSRRNSLLSLSRMAFRRDKPARFSMRRNALWLTSRCSSFVSDSRFSSFVISLNANTSVFKLPHASRFSIRESPTPCRSRRVKTPASAPKNRVARRKVSPSGAPDINRSPCTSSRSRRSRSSSASHAVSCVSYSKSNAALRTSNAADAAQDASSFSARFSSPSFLFSSFLFSSTSSLARSALAAAPRNLARGLATTRASNGRRSSALSHLCETKRGSVHSRNRRLETSSPARTSRFTDLSASTTSY
mmetsp:Transcript_5399/g.22855  ORF Transcript_5399/g.22855 Transcript_5399/m.22855 type:complete len:393 (-) Transcript_5399:498-1676(-)